MTDDRLPTVRYWDYRIGYRHCRQELLNLVDEVFDSGRLVLGSRVATFEEHFATFCGARFGIGVNSGTDALFLSLKALGIGAGDEVVTVANTAIPTVAAIRAAGAVPVFVDVEENTQLMDVGRVEAALTPKTRCLLPVHLAGLPVDLAPLLELAAARQIAVLEDCAQAAGAEYHGKRVGSFGAVGAFSFYPTKILGAYGDGGMAVTSSQELCTRLRRLRFYGIDANYHAEEEGYNSRLDEVQAALLDQRLAGIEVEVERRRTIAACYDKGLADVGDVAIPPVPAGRTHQFYLYTIRTARRDQLMSWLNERGIETRINYPTPVHLMRGYRFLGYRPGDLPITERLAGEILSLPMYPDLPLDDAARVIETIRAFFRT
ncbi:MAG: DegT/DnrJ/EryC1/StrS family aminotransferase [Gemmatimonadales bacterium]|nr:MAG: DegT/DnrJ/EryC1/StrS family aminotransferase [Gemmatimonadales bacterium]